MAQPLDYAHLDTQPPSRRLAIAAHLTLAYPLLLLACLYGQWLLSWLVLGHQPRPSLDDPKYIAGASWMHIITTFALIGFLPAGCTALVLNAFYVHDHRLNGIRLILRTLFLALLWAGTFMFLRWDPWQVGNWWMD